MKDCDGKPVQTGDIILIPIDGEIFHEEKICEEWEVINALRHKDGTIIPYNNEAGYLLK